MCLPSRQLIIFAISAIVVLHGAAPAAATDRVESVEQARTDSLLAQLGRAAHHSVSGDFAAAEACYRQCADTSQRLLGSVHRITIDATIGQARSLIDLGDYTAAERALRPCFDASLAINGEWSPQTGDLTLELAEVLFELGWQAEATRLFRRAAMIMERIHGPDHRRTAASLAGLAQTERRFGDQLTAAKLYSRAIEIVERSEGLQHPDLIRYYCRRGMCHANKSLLERGLADVEHGIAIATATYGPASYQVAMEQRHRGLILRYLGRHAEAIEVLERVLPTLQRHHGNEHPFLSKCFKGLGESYNAEHHYAQAHSYFARAIQLHEHIDERDQRELGFLLSKQASVAAALGRWDETVGHAMRVVETELMLSEDLSKVFSTREHLNFTVRPKVAVENLLFTITEHPSLPEAAFQRVFALVARVHGLVLDRLVERQRNLALVLDVADVEQARWNYLKARQQVADLFVKGPGDSPPAHRAAVASACQNMEDAERVLAAMSEEVRQATQAKRLDDGIPAEQLASVLEPGEMLVHYVRCRSFPTENRPNRRLRYAAYRLRRESTHRWDLEYIDLASTTAVDSTIFAYRRAIDSLDQRRRPSAREEAQYRLVARRAYDQLLAPVLRPLPGDGTGASATAGADGGDEVPDADAPMVFIVPMSWLSLVDFNSLICPSGELVIERNKIHLLSSAEDLLRPARTSPCGAGLLAVGNPTITPRPVTITTDGGANAEIGPLPVLCDEAYEVSTPLPGAELESNAVARLFTEATGESTTQLLGPAGTEEAVKAHITGRRMVHLATHGFFCDSALGGTTASMGRLVDPLLNAGLILGASPGVEDGILTAQEVASLDLRDLDWVVLSACGSGLGDLVFGEGLYGLRRAFELAGARTVLMALWRIEDNSMRGLMEQIYRRRLAGSSTVDAVRHAQLDRLRDVRRRLNRLHPILWGGIVAEGDWR